MIFLKLKKKLLIDWTNFFNLQNHPTFLSEERLVNLERGREFCCSVPIGLKFAYLFSDWRAFLSADGAGWLEGRQTWPRGRGGWTGSW